MLSKLMKHEFRATGRIMLPLFLLVMVTAVGANFSTRKLMEASNDFANIIGAMLLVAFTLAIAGTCIVVFLLMVQRFQKNLMGDEGYVMMTLPASVHEHVWSKMLVSTVWFAATAVVVVLACFIMVYDVGFVEEIFEGLRELLDRLYWEDMVDMAHVSGYCVEMVLLCVLASFSMCLDFYCAIAIGHSFANHKILFSVIAFFGLDFLLDIIGSVTMQALNMSDWLENLNIDGPAELHVALLGVAAAMAVYSALYYVLTVWFMKKRLNLE